MTATTYTRQLADQLAAGTTIRRIRLADGTTFDHEVGEVYWVDRILLLSKTHNNQTQTTEPTE